MREHGTHERTHLESIVAADDIDRPHTHLVRVCVARTYTCGRRALVQAQGVRGEKIISPCLSVTGVSQAFFASD